MNQTRSNHLSIQRGCPRRPASQRMAGVTLIELMTSVSLVAILMAIAVPSYKYVTNANRLAGEVNGLLGDMQFARGQAIKEGQNVVICSSSDGATCATGGNNTSWKSGWIVFSDVNANGSVDAGETVRRVQNAFNSSDTFNADNNVSAVSFNREGFAPGGNIVTIKLHDSTADPKWTRCLKINIVGMLMTTRYSTLTTPSWPGPCT
jgi:type IV fimbrial biogenesis protein FimT